MISRFKGPDGQRRLKALLTEQKLILGDSALAEDFRAAGKIVFWDRGDTIIQQDHPSNDVHFILHGSFDIVVNGRVIAQRMAREHVGEMAALEASMRRTASVIAKERSVTLSVTESDFSKVAETNPLVYRRVACELVRRLEQRNRLVASVNKKTRVFIMSSREALPIARQLKRLIPSKLCVMRIWTDGVFLASHYPLESLESVLDTTDIAVAVAHSDDIIAKRGKVSPVSRDNVTFELGYFMGRLGRRRTILLVPEQVPLSQPSDLMGLNPIMYRYDSSRPKASMVPASAELASTIRRLGPNR